VSPARPRAGAGGDLTDLDDTAGVNGVVLDRPAGARRHRQGAGPGSRRRGLDDDQRIADGGRVELPPSPLLLYPTELTWVPGRSPLAAHDRGCRVGGRAHDISRSHGVLDRGQGLCRDPGGDELAGQCPRLRLVPARRSARSAPSGRRASARAWARACTPVPITVTRLAPGRASRPGRHSGSGPPSARGGHVGAVDNRDRSPRWPDQSSKIRAWWVGQSWFCGNKLTKLGGSGAPAEGR